MTTAQKKGVLDTGFKENITYVTNYIQSTSTYFLTNVSESHESFLEEIIFGLTRIPKYIHPKFFYNKKGSQLFDKICELPEYYLTRVETKILEKIRNQFSKYLQGIDRLVELGSGSSIKTRAILNILTKTQKEVVYFPIDISDIMESIAEQIEKEYNNLHVIPIKASYEKGLELSRKLVPGKKLFIFLGSSIGNFTTEHRRIFLKKIYDSMNKDELLLIGFDLVKDPIILNAAYNDVQGITAQFNLNVLERINENAGANFDLSKFEHVAFFNPNESRIEMYLKSKISQKVLLSKTNQMISFEKNEAVLTEYSYKFTISDIKRIAKVIPFKMLKIWKDENSYFALALFSKP